MPFDPNNPVNGVLIDANFLRGQFNGLKDLIDAVPGLSDVVIDSVTTSMHDGRPYNREVEHARWRVSFLSSLHDAHQVLEWRGEEWKQREAEYVQRLQEARAELDRLAQRGPAAARSHGARGKPPGGPGSRPN